MGISVLNPAAASGGFDQTKMSLRHTITSTTNNIGIPAGTTYVYVKMIGAGGGGGVTNNVSNNFTTGGGAGGYIEGWVLASNTATIGTSGAGDRGGSTIYSTLIAGGGAGGNDVYNSPSDGNHAGSGSAGGASAGNTNSKAGVATARQNYYTSESWGDIHSGNFYGGLNNTRVASYIYSGAGGSVTVNTTTGYNGIFAGGGGSGSTSTNGAGAGGSGAFSGAARLSENQGGGGGGLLAAGSGMNGGSGGGGGAGKFAYGNTPVGVGGSGAVLIYY